MHWTLLTAASTAHCLFAFQPPSPANYHRLAVNRRSAATFYHLPRCRSAVTHVPRPNVGSAGTEHHVHWTHGAWLCYTCCRLSGWQLLEPSTNLYNPLQPSTTLYNPLQPSTTLYNRLQPSTALHNALHSARPPQPSAGKSVGRGGIAVGVWVGAPQQTRGPVCTIRATIPSEARRLANTSAHPPPIRKGCWR